MKFKINDKLIDGVVEAPKWVAKGLEPEAVMYAEEFGKWLAGQETTGGQLRDSEKLTTTQFRNIFSEVVRIRLQDFNEKNEKALLLLKPRMAYNMARQNKRGGQSLNEVMQPAMDAVFKGKNRDEKQIRFNHFADLFEAILAYHRVYESKRQNKKD